MFARGPYLGLKLLLFVCLSIALMIADDHQGFFRHVRAAASTIVSPIQYIVNEPVKWFHWLDQSVSSHQSIQAENTDLKAQNLLLKARLQKLLALQNENSQLRALLQTYPRSSEHVMVAQLLAVDSASFVHQVILNHGSHSGVYVGQPVLDSGGVFGQVISVGPYTSRVLLLSDSRSAIPIQDGNSGVRGLVVGTGNPNKLKLIHISATSDVKVGDELVSSGLGQQFPAGYPVGKVTKVIDSPGEEFATIWLTPNAHLSSSRLVLLVWPAHWKLVLKHNKAFANAVANLKQTAKQQRGKA